MSKDSALAMAQALKAKSEEKAKLTEETACNAFLNQEKVINEALNKSTESISNAINDQSKDLLIALNSKNEDLSKALNNLIDTFNTNNATARRVLFKSWGITLIGLAFLLLLGCGALWYQAKMISENWDEIAQQNQQKKELEPLKIRTVKDEKGMNYVILPKGAKIQDTYESDKGLQVMRWTK